MTTKSKEDIKQIAAKMKESNPLLVEFAALFDLRVVGSETLDKEKSKNP